VGKQGSAKDLGELGEEDHDQGLVSFLIPGCCIIKWGAGARVPDTWHSFAGNVANRASPINNTLAMVIASEPIVLARPLRS